MKKKISISIEENTIKKVSDVVKQGTFRSNSHFIELAVVKFLEKEK